MSHLLQHIKDVAILGTEKRAIDTSLLPPNIAQIYKNNDFENNETAFLSLLSISTYYHKAGALPLKHEGSPVFEGITEQQTYAPDELHHVFLKIKNFLENEILKEFLFVQYLQLLHQHNWLASKPTIPYLVIWYNLTNKKNQHKIKKVIGNKGRSLLEEKSVLIRSEDIWDEGSFDAKKQYLETLRKKNPEKGLALLLSTWNGDSITHKLAYLKIITASLVSTDIPFLEDVFENEFAFAEKEKKTYGTCRQTIAGALLALEDSKLHAEVSQNLRRYIKTPKGVLAKMFKDSNSLLLLPSEEDGFWNSTRLLKSFGVTDTSIDIAYFSNSIAYLMAFYVENISLLNWAAILNIPIPKVIDFFVNDKQFQNTIKGVTNSYLLRPLLQSSIKYPNVLVSRELLTVKQLHVDDVLMLLNHIPQEEWEHYIKKNELYLDPHYLNTFPIAKGIWSQEFSELWLRWSLRNFDKKFNFNYQLASIVPKFFNFNSLPLLEKKHIELSNELTNKQSWDKHLYDPIHETTSIRQLLNPFQ